MSTHANVHDYDMDNPIEGERERFQVTDDSQAAWAMRKLLSLRQKMTENENIAEAERYRINSWLEYANSRYEDDVAYFEGLLTQYAKTQRETEGRKTIDTPYGFVKSRATQPKFKVTDEDEFFKWAAESLPDAVAVKYTPVIPVMRNALTVEHTTTLGLVAMTENGEIVPGVTVEPAGVNYNVEVTK